MRLSGLILLFVFCGSSIHVAAEELPSWRQDVEGIVERYCAGCHNQDDAEGDLAFESYADLLVDREVATDSRLEPVKIHAADRHLHLRERVLNFPLEGRVYNSLFVEKLRPQTPHLDGEDILRHRFLLFVC